MALGPFQSRNESEERVRAHSVSLPPMNGFEECLAGLLELLRRLVVADLISGFVEYFKTKAGFQIVFGIGQ